MESDIHNILSSNNNTGYIKHDGKQMKITVKEIYKNSAACEACRVSKKKCNGVSPCSRVSLKYIYKLCIIIM